MFNEEMLKSIFGDMKKNLDEAREKVKDNILTAKSGGGLVSISMNGVGEVIDLNIDDSLLEDKESLQILLMSAFNDLVKSMEENRNNAALGMLGNIGDFDLKKFGM